MARQKRLDRVGYYYVSNEGRGENFIFKEAQDYHYFESLLCTYAKKYAFTVHSYALIGLEYCLLLEIHLPNLSRFMGQINGDYALYYNKKYALSGHLWRERFKSWYITEEAHIEAAIRHVEHKPYASGYRKNRGTYRYSSYQYFIEPMLVTECFKDAWILKKFGYDIDKIKIFFNQRADDKLIQLFKNKSRKLKPISTHISLDLSILRYMFKYEMPKGERNSQIVKAYEEGFSQYQIAKVLNLSQPAIHGVIKRAQV